VALAATGSAILSARLSGGRRSQAGRVFFSGHDAVAAPPAINLLSDLPDRLSTGLLGHAILKHLAADEVLFLAGDPGDGFYRLDEGLLKVSIASATGAERILAILGPGSIVGDLAIIDGLPRSASVSALRDCKLRFVSRRSFEIFAGKQPEIYHTLAKILASRLRDTDQIVAAGSFLPLKGRVARALLDLAHAFGKDVGAGRVVIRQKVSQGDLAAMAGIARENVSRIMNDWMRAKIITRLSGYYCLEDPGKLKHEIEL
jgi:CRP/FNR family transcriptional regulator, cyclic AMP receptor protein